MFSYQFHIRDYLTKTRHLSLLEDLAYRRLIDSYYTEESPLPVDVQACARLIAMRDHADAVEAVLKEFFLLTDAGWTNARCDQEIAKYRSHQERGRHAAASRWVSPQTQQASMEDQCIDAPQMPTNNQKPDNQKPEKKPKTTASKAVRFDWESEQWVNVDRMIPTWVSAYPGVDVAIELARAKAWVLQNPDKAAGMSNWGQFLGNWMRRTGAVPRTVPAAGQTPTVSNLFEGLA